MSRKAFCSVASRQQSISLTASIDEKNDDSVLSQLHISLQRKVFKVASLSETRDNLGFIWNSDCLERIDWFGIPQQPRNQDDWQISDWVLLVIYLILFTYLTNTVCQALF